MDGLISCDGRDGEEPRLHEGSILDVPGTFNPYLAAVVMLIYLLGSGQDGVGEGTRSTCIPGDTPPPLASLSPQRQAIQIPPVSQPGHSHLTRSLSSILLFWWLFPSKDTTETQTAGLWWCRSARGCSASRASAGGAASSGVQSSPAWLPRNPQSVPFRHCRPGCRCCCRYCCCRQWRIREH